MFKYDAIKVKNLLENYVIMRKIKLKMIITKILRQTVDKHNKYKKNMINIDTYNKY